MRKQVICLFAFVIVLFLVGNVRADICCEKTTGGAWCQNVNAIGQCNQGINPVTGSSYGVMPTSCDATSYCKLGTCIDNQEGICTPNTPEIICDANHGFWKDASVDSLPQCQAGCCLIGDQAAFTTQASCNRMSALYNLRVSFETNINNEIDCLASANPQSMGACVYTANYVTTCTKETRQDCQTRAKNSAYANVTFHDGFLCTAQELGDNCAKTTRTACDDKGDIRFIDSCNNLANIYDSSKVNDENYWTKIQDPSCSDGKGNKNSASCGDCDYISGSMCKQKTTGQAVDDGNYICKDLDCVDYKGQDFTGTNGNYPKHGETWCATDSKTGDYNSPGATYYKMICMNGEVTSVECDSTRQEICAETVIDNSSGFKEANCRKNYWDDCYSQNNSGDCEDTNVRDCHWISWEGYSFTDRGIQNTGDSQGLCVPAYPPGFQRDGSSTATDNCGLASAVCFVKMTSGNAFGGGGWSCDRGNPGNNCSCLDATWQQNLNNVCVQLGDCGTKTNYIGINGAKRTDILTIQPGSAA